MAKDESSALRWYRKAAEQGYAQAQSNLGFMYEHGKGVAKDESTAVKWYRMAAEQGYADAQCNLGIMYMIGKGVPHDRSEALRWLRKAEAQGNDEAAELIPQLLETVAVLPSHSSPWIIGTKVELHGIKAKPELNGQRGVVVQLIADSTRCRVQLNNGQGQFSVKLQSLRIPYEG